MFKLMLLFLVSFVMGCSSNDGGQTTDEPDGTHSLAADTEYGLTSQTLVHDGVIREFLLYVPASYDGSTSVPLVFNFHGNGGTSDAHMSVADMRPIADSEGFITVYPQGVPLDGSSHWNSLMGAEGNKSQTDDIGFISSLLTLLGSNYSIDSSRVYASGYSNGADFSFMLACYLSDSIAAIAPVSGLMADLTLQPCSPTHPTTVVILNGTGDFIRPYTGITGYLQGVDDAAAFWVGHNNIETPAEVTNFDADGLNVERYQYSGGDADTRVEVFKVIDGGHIWFDFDIDGTRATRFIWDVLSQYDQDGLRP